MNIVPYDLNMPQMIYFMQCMAHLIPFLSHSFDFHFTSFVLHLKVAWSYKSVSDC
jgi:ubiquinone/menaquinone biosynthesis C-methylase UbiE